ncbi:gamma-glutamyl-gamma-aminobutyrate hydrolase family protein [Candidatus Sumerlaeota bacterium]|nr:gamma-glutamyl-gamma-aminobutyrate hydrolase family protein [Candidatus Sumerlaeota bacterium]
MAKSRPRIAVTCGYTPKKPDGIGDNNVSVVRTATNYTDAVNRAGGLPVPMIPLVDDGQPMAYAEMCDGLLLTGGPDIHPRHFGEETPHEKNKPLPPEREDFDFAVLRAFLDLGKPVLGICLGHQQINVALGGTIHQHLPDVVEGWPIEHIWRDRDTTPLPRHEVEIVEGTRLAEVVGTCRLVTNSSHHQGVDRIAPGLRQTAVAADGVLEGLESIEGDQILTVQWHPEYLIDDPPHLALFRDLVERSRRFATR